MILKKKKKSAINHELARSLSPQKGNCLSTSLGPINFHTGYCHLVNDNWGFNLRGNICFFELARFIPQKKIALGIPEGVKLSSHIGYCHLVNENWGFNIRKNMTFFSSCEIFILWREFPLGTPERIQLISFISYCHLVNKNWGFNLQWNVSVFEFARNHYRAGGWMVDG